MIENIEQKFLKRIPPFTLKSLKDALELREMASRQWDLTFNSMNEGRSPVNAQALASIMLKLNTLDKLVMEINDEIFTLCERLMLLDRQVPIIHYEIVDGKLVERVIS